MTVFVTCIRCHQHRPRGTRCPCKPPLRGKNPTAQQNARKRTLARYGNQCAWVDDGIRCPVTNPLEACHIVRYADGGSDDDSNLVLLCLHHHLEHDRSRR